ATHQRLDMELHVAFAAALLQSTGVAEKSWVAASEAHRLAEVLGDAKTQLLALWIQWSYQYNLGEHRAALLLAEHFAEVAGRGGEAIDIVRGDRLMGISVHYQGDQAKARKDLERVLARYVAAGDRRRAMWYRHDERAVTRAMLSRVLCLQGFVDQAKRIVR